MDRRQRSAIVVVAAAVGDHRAIHLRSIKGEEGRRPARSVELWSLLSPPTVEEPKPPQLLPLHVLITYLNGTAEEVFFVATDIATGHPGADPRPRPAHRDRADVPRPMAVGQWPVVIPEVELAMS
ncbi:hypothetical protein EJB05_15665, partial [Eragrostis curvula]